MIIDDTNSLFTESSFDNDQELITEWTVDSDKKKKYVSSAIKGLNSLITKYKLTNSVSCLKESDVIKANKQNIYGSKKKLVIIGAYNFKGSRDNLSILKNAINDFNNTHFDIKLTLGATKDTKTWAIIVGLFLSVLGGVAINEIAKAYAGIIYVKIKKDAMSESYTSIKESGTEFSEYIMESLFR